MIEPFHSLTRNQLQDLLKERDLFEDTTARHHIFMIASGIAALEAMELPVNKDLFQIFENFGARTRALATRADGRTVTLPPSGELSRMPSMGDDGNISWRFGRPRDLLDHDAGLTGD